MKKTTKIIPKCTKIIPEKEVEIYVANDGTEFYSESECLGHERKLKYEAMKRNAKTQVLKRGIKILEDNYYYCRNEDDFKTFRTYMAYCYGSSSDVSRFADKTVLDFKFEGEDWYWVDIYEYVDDYGYCDERLELFSLTKKKKSYEEMKERYESFFSKFG